MKKLSIPEFAKVLTENPEKELYIAANYDEENGAFTADCCDTWFAFEVTSIGDCPVLLANYCGSTEPYDVAAYPIAGYYDNLTGETNDLEHAIAKYMQKIDELHYCNMDNVVYFDDEAAEI